MCSGAESEEKRSPMTPTAKLHIRLVVYSTIEILTKDEKWVTEIKDKMAA